MRDHSLFTLCYSNLQRMEKKNVLFREQVRCASAGWHIDMDS